MSNRVGYPVHTGRYTAIMGFVRPPMSLLVPVASRLVYAIYTGLAVAASEAALRIFDQDAPNRGCSKSEIGAVR